MTKLGQYGISSGKVEEIFQLMGHSIYINTKQQSKSSDHKRLYSHKHC